MRYSTTIGLAALLAGLACGASAEALMQGYTRQVALDLPQPTIPATALEAPIAPAADLLSYLGEALIGAVRPPERIEGSNHAVRPVGLPWTPADASTGWEGADLQAWLGALGPASSSATDYVPLNNRNAFADLFDSRRYQAASDRAPRGGQEMEASRLEALLEKRWFWMALVALVGAAALVSVLAHLRREGALAV